MYKTVLLKLLPNNPTFMHFLGLSTIVVSTSIYKSKWGKNYLYFIIGIISWAKVSASWCHHQVW